MLTYYQCKDCGFVEPEAKWHKQQTAQVCPDCAAVGKNADWPSMEILELMTFVRDYDKISSEYGLVASVFLSSALELLLEHLIFKMAIEDLLYEEAGHLVELLLDAYQGRSRRLQLFAKVGYGSFREETTELGHCGFLGHWDEIAEARNKTVHGDPKFARTVTPQLVECTIGEGLEVFSKLNNRYARSLERETASARKGDLERLRRWNAGLANAGD